MFQDPGRWPMNSSRITDYYYSRTRKWFALRQKCFNLHSNIKCWNPQIIIDLSTVSCSLVASTHRLLLLSSTLWLDKFTHQIWKELKMIQAKKDNLFRRILIVGRLWHDKCWQWLHAWRVRCTLKVLIGSE